MAFLIKYNAKEPIRIDPDNGDNFTRFDICQLLDCSKIEYYHVLTHTGKLSAYIMAYDTKYFLNIDRFNLIATRAFLKGLYSQKDYAIYCISMRLNKHVFFEHYPELSFIGGHAIIGTISEMKDFAYNKDTYK